MYKLYINSTSVFVLLGDFPQTFMRERRNGIDLRNKPCVPHCCKDTPKLFDPRHRETVRRGPKFQIKSLNMGSLAYFEIWLTQNCPIVNLLQVVES